MIGFEWPWLALILPLPYFVYRYARPFNVAMSSALRVPFLDDFAEAEPDIRRKSRPWPLWIAIFAWCLLVVSAMRPQWLGDLVDIPVTGRELMLAVDLSGSMEQQDFSLGGRRIDRLAATKLVAGDFIERRVGDRIGLILFGEQAYLQAPLTFDRETVRTLLSEAVIGLAGKATAIGDAIGLAVKRLRERDESQRVLVLLTDGANTAGVVDPLSAAQLASREGLKIYSIGIGATELVERSLFGARKINPSADLDEAALKEIANLTGGAYFRARDLGELEQVYALIDELEPVEQDPKKFRPQISLYYWPLAAALLLGALLTLMYRGGQAADQLRPAGLGQIPGLSPATMRLP